MFLSLVCLEINYPDFISSKVNALDNQDEYFWSQNKDKLLDAKRRLNFFQQWSVAPMSSANKAFERFLKSLPPDVVASFNSNQLKAMSSAIRQDAHQHPVDLRVSIPFFWKRFYLVLLIGPERRTAERLKVDRQNHPVWTVGNASVLLGLIGFGLLLSLGFSQLNLVTNMLLTPEQIRGSSPVAIPFIENETDCVDSGRSWENGECIDYGHDRRF
jgi:hypothetical protein